MTTEQAPTSAPAPAPVQSYTNEEMDPRRQEAAIVAFSSDFYVCAGEARADVAAGTSPSRSALYRGLMAHAQGTLDKLMAQQHGVATIIGELQRFDLAIGGKLPLSEVFMPSIEATVGQRAQHLVILRERRRVIAQALRDGPRFLFAVRAIIADKEDKSEEVKKLEERIRKLEETVTYLNTRLAEVCVTMQGPIDTKLAITETITPAPKAKPNRRTKKV